MFDCSRFNDLCLSGHVCVPGSACKPRSWLDGPCFARWFFAIACCCHETAKSGASSRKRMRAGVRCADTSGRRDVMPTDVKERAKFVYSRPTWGRGMITEDDARFLHDLVLEIRPDVAVEVGV